MKRQYITKGNWRRAWKGRVLHYVQDGHARCGQTIKSWDVHIYSEQTTVRRCSRCQEVLGEES